MSVLNLQNQLYLLRARIKQVRSGRKKNGPLQQDGGRCAQKEIRHRCGSSSLCQRESQNCGVHVSHAQEQVRATSHIFH